MSPRTSGRKNRKQKAADSVIQGSILAMAGIVVCIIDMLYRTPLNDITGRQGSRYYTSAFNVYNILLILSSYSMPVTVSKMILARLARREHRNCSRILKAALIYATAVGGIVAVVLWFGADLFVELIKTPFNRHVLKTLALTIQIMAYLGVPRGCFQGMDTMAPMAVSQILEQIVNVVANVVVAGVLSGVGTFINAAQGARDYSYALSAAGGTTGTGVGALTAFLFFICLTASKEWERRQLVREGVSGRTESYRRISYVLTITALPIVISSGIYNCSSVVDNYLFGQGVDKLGYLGGSTTTYWGILGQYQLFSDIPMTVPNALSSSPILSLIRAIANRSRRKKPERIVTSIRLSLLIVIPAAVGVTVLAKPVCSLLFISEDNTILMRLSMAGSLAVVFYSLSTVTNAILQGLNHMDVSIRHAATALVIHVAALEMFLIVLKMEIYSVVFANIIFALTMCLLNRHTIARLARYRQEYKRTLILPTICAGFMGAATYGVYRGIYALFPYRLMRGRIGMAIVVFPSVATTVLVYAVLLVRPRAVEEEELKGMPGGGRLVRLPNRFRLLG